MTNARRLARAAVLAAFFHMPIGAHAGVLHAPEGAASDAARANREILNSTKAAGESQGSRTVDLLIELQQKRPGVDFSERAGTQSESGSTRSGSAMQGEASGVGNGSRPDATSGASGASPLGLFGTRAAAPVVREVSTQRSPAENGGEAAEPGSGNRMAANRSTDVPWWMHPAGWLGALRENRVWIGVGAVLLLIGWVGTRLMVRHAH